MSRTRLSLALLTLCYLLATLPYLSDYPRLEAAQMGIMAPAHKLANTGVYGNDLYRGLYNAEQRNYEYMPLYALTVASAFQLAGVSVLPARLVSVLCGLAIVWLSFAIGRKLGRDRVGLLAAGVLVLLPITVPNYGRGDMYPGAIPLLDFARVVRYDVMMAMWVLAAVWAFISALSNTTIGAKHLPQSVRDKPKIMGRMLRPYPRFSENSLFFLTGILVGLATLSHLYGMFILVVFGIILLAHYRGRIWREPGGYLLIIGWALTLLPWLIYILGDLPAYQGQMLRHQTRFDLLDPSFYLDSLRREPWRYLKFIGRFNPPALFPRPGFWLMLVSLAAGNVGLFLRKTDTQVSVTSESDTHLNHEAGIVRRHSPQAYQSPLSKKAAVWLTWLALPVLAGLLALTISFKRYAYVMLILPFLALQIGYGLNALIIWSRQRSRYLYVGLLVFMAFALGEGIISIAQNLNAARTTTPFLTITAPANAIIPPSARTLIFHDYWLGFADHNVYAFDLAFNMSNPQFHFAGAPTMTQALTQLTPDYIVVPTELLTAYQTAPHTIPSDLVSAQWQGIDAYLQTYCNLIYTGITDRDYGTLVVLECK